MEDLRKPEALPDPTEGVEVLQTHISTVFIGRDFVYKIKKPVNFGFLDFSTLEKRRYYCEREVELNRRFSRDLYMGVVPIFSSDGGFTMTVPNGEPVEYAVRMRRINDELLMDRVFAKGSLTDSNLRDVARFLAGFHSSAEGGAAIAEFGKAQKFKINTDENFEQVRPFIGKTIDNELYHDLYRWTEDFYAPNGSLFDRRIGEGRVRDCHGDLHMQHICLSDPVQSFDCIEFNDRFRYGDTLADIAFLLMDMEYRGGREQSKALWNYYRKDAKEEEGVESLLVFYKVYRAFVRGKVIGFIVDDNGIDPNVRTQAALTAARYFSLADSFIRDLPT
jgi:aminoglycoside phosphotransferase family enzyme